MMRGTGEGAEIVVDQARRLLVQTVEQRHVVVPFVPYSVRPLMKDIIMRLFVVTPGFRVEHRELQVRDHVVGALDRPHTVRVICQP